MTNFLRNLPKVIFYIESLAYFWGFLNLNLGCIMTNGTTLR